MKKLQLQFGSIKEMLSKDQMKKISGGDWYCNKIDDNGSIDTGTRIHVYSQPNVTDCCKAQEVADLTASDDPNFTDMFPNGCDVECDLQC